MAPAAAACWTGEVRFGVHLPLIDFGGPRLTVERLVEYAETATRLGFDALSVNDHLVFTLPWLDGPTALAAVTSCTGSARLFTTVVNPVVRGPVATAKMLAGLDVLSGGRVTAGLGPGSSERDYASVGVPFDERWPRFDEAARALRALLRGDSFQGRFYSVDGPLEPSPTQSGGPPLWIGSWGSVAGLRRVARSGDGWLASAYNTTPEAFAGAWRRLRQEIAGRGGDPDAWGNGLATLWFHLGDDAEAMLTERLAPAIHRPVEELRERLAFGRAEAVVEKLAAFEEAGLQRVFVWPVADELEQLHRFSHDVMPLLST
jgi:alkanesulfonate monooxygenase SsuD/methylene tetrahydromethanopterin reductase-like flavin-dependent oxidoreductase (luciferase family)